MRVRRFLIASTTAALGLLALANASTASAATTITNNNDGSFTVTDTAGAPNGVVWICPTTIAASSCDGDASRWEYNFFGLITTKIFSLGTPVTQNGRGAGAISNVPLPAGIYNIGVGTISGARDATLTNVTIGSGGGGGGSSTAAVPAPTFEIALTPTDGTTCTSSGQSATGGTWLTLPGANDCTPPASKAGATLLGWSTTPNFPVAIAQRQVTNGWGTYETINSAGEITSVFIPAGRATFLSGANSLYAIWNK